MDETTVDNSQQEPGEPNAAVQETVAPTPADYARDGATAISAAFDALDSGGEAEASDADKTLQEHGITPDQVAQPAPAGEKVSAPAAEAPAATNDAALDKLLAALGVTNEPASTAAQPTDAKSPATMAAATDPKTAPDAKASLDDHANSFVKFMRDEFGEDAAKAATAFAEGITAKNKQIASSLERMESLTRDVALQHDPMNVAIDGKASGDTTNKTLYGESWMKATPEQKSNRELVAQTMVKMAQSAISKGQTITPDLEQVLFNAATHHVAKNTPAGKSARTEVINRSAAQRQGQRVAVPGRATASGLPMSRSEANKSGRQSLADVGSAAIAAALGQLNG